MKKQVKTGLGNLVDDPPEYLKGKRLGLLCNPASVDPQFNHASDLIRKIFPGQLTVLFSPQHGFYADQQDNMIESDHFIEPELNIPVYSLYSHTRIPTKEMFDHLDILLVDIQDVGTRVYTFIYTVSYCLELAAQLKKQVVILDRPNPIGGSLVEGNLLSKEYRSFVGRFPIPMRHGMTIGEISQFFNQEYQLGCDLTVLPMKGWQRSMYWEDTGLSWIAPSPNLPTPWACMVYPGQVILEGTNISEGRGTTLPFEQFGAPFLDTRRIKTAAKKYIKGAFLRPVNFEPTSGKWMGTICRGFQIHVTSKEEFRPYFASLLLLQLIIRYHGDEFQMKPPPYEYEYEKLPMDLILGSKILRKQLTEGEDTMVFQDQWQKEEDEFKHLSQRYYLYE